MKQQPLNGSRRGKGGVVAPVCGFSQRITIIFFLDCQAGKQIQKAFSSLGLAKKDKIIKTLLPGTENL